MQKITLMLCATILFLPFFAFGQKKPIIINEIAWMGTNVSANNEWIELYNESEADIDMTGWVLKAADGAPNINLQDKIPSKGFFLLERTDDDTIPNVPADQIYQSALSNNGEKILLTDPSGQVIDIVDCSNGWPAGDNKTKQTMERVSVRHMSDTSLTPWQNSSQPGGTPRRTNVSATINNQPPTTDLQQLRNNQPPMASQQSTSSDQPSTTSQLLTNSHQQGQSPETTTLPATTGVATAAQPAGVKPRRGDDKVLINEIMASPKGADSEGEWIELFNPNNSSVNLSEWKIRDTMGTIKTYAFPSGTEIPASGFFALTRPQSKITLQNNGDGLELLNPADKIVDRADFGQAPQGQSWAKNQQGAWQWTINPTLGEPNVMGTQKINSAALSQQPTTSSSKLSNNGIANIAEVADKKPAVKSLGPLIGFLIGLAIAAASAIVALILHKKSSL